MGFWRPGQTVWIKCWGDDHTPTQQEATALVKQEASPERQELFEEQDGAVYRYGYLLVEQEVGKRRYAVIPSARSPAQARREILGDQLLVEGFEPLDVGTDGALGIEIVRVERSDPGE